MNVGSGKPLYTDTNARSFRPCGITARFTLIDTTLSLQV